MAKKKLLALLLGGFLASGIVNAEAADKVVMFKIHDVTPVKNADNVVESCEFATTFYNNTSSKISNVNLELKWKDKVIDTTIKDERKESRSFRGNKIQDDVSTRQVNTEFYTNVEVRTNVSIPPLAPNKQLTVKSKIETDRCFLLLENVDYKVVSCRATYQEKANNGKLQEKTGECSDLFKFYSAENPEYYTSFKKISYEEEKEQQDQKMVQEKKEIDDIYKKTLTAIERIGTVADAIAKQ